MISLVLMLLTACAGTSRLATRSEPEAEEAAELEEAPDEFADAGMEPQDAAPPAPVVAEVATTAAPEPACGPREGGTHCVLLELVRPSPEHAAQVVARLAADGLTASAEGERVEVILSDEQVRTLLGGRVVYAERAASATDRMICEAEIEQARIPRRLRRLVARAAVGHQICE